MTEAREITFVLNISPDEYLRYYQGAARHVIARGRDGRTVQFAAGLLRRFLTHDGVHGVFRLRFDDNNRLVSLDRVESAR
ncbi:MAG: DUF2835 domain-containing protein [Gammaproteobacteria bacterium]|jgi:hypothetical protein|nr:DUF2835 domain-containing protein [Gammaproteobacteria bacterium]